MIGVCVLFVGEASVWGWFNPRFLQFLWGGWGWFMGFSGETSCRSAGMGDPPSPLQLDRDVVPVV